MKTMLYIYISIRFVLTAESGMRDRERPEKATRN